MKNKYEDWENVIRENFYLGEQYEDRRLIELLREEKREWCSGWGYLYVF